MKSELSKTTGTAKFKEETQAIDLSCHTLPSINTDLDLILRDKIKKEVAQLRKFGEQDIYLLPSQRTGPERFITAAERQRRRTIANEEAFLKYCTPFILPGNTDMIIIGYSGLTTPNYSMRRLLVETYRRFGMHTELYSLCGNDGTHESLRKTTERDMINFLKERVAALPKAQPGKAAPKIVVMGFSTGCEAALALEAESPGTFDAIVNIGAPLNLRNKKHKFLLWAGDKLDKTLSFLRNLKTETRDALADITRDSYQKVMAPFRRLQSFLRKRRKTVNSRPHDLCFAAFPVRAASMRL